MKKNAPGWTDKNGSIGDGFSNRPPTRRGTSHREIQRDRIKRGKKATTPISAAELLEGAYYIQGKYLAAAKELLQSLEILEFDLEAADRAGEIGAELAKKGRQIGIADTMIAGIVKRHGERLITRDRHYQEVRGLIIESY